MNLEQDLSDWFVDHLTTVQQSLNELSDSLTMAAELTGNTMMNGGRALVCGMGDHDLIARHLVNRFHFGTAHERPALPAVHIELPGYYLSRSDSHLSHPLSALAQESDLLVILSSGQDIQGLTTLLGIAEYRSVPVVLLGSEFSNYHIPEFGQPVLDLRIPSRDLDRISELQWLCCNTLVNLVDKLLFGTQD